VAKRSCDRPAILGDILTSILKRNGLEKGFKGAKVVAHWTEIVGEGMAEHTRPAAIEGGILYLEVDSAAWRTQLFAMKKEIIRKVNDFAGKGFIKNIFFK